MMFQLNWQSSSFSFYTFNLQLTGSKVVCNTFVSCVTRSLPSACPCLCDLCLFCLTKDITVPCQGPAQAGVLELPVEVPNCKRGCVALEEEQTWMW